jgi:multidrug resistance efflux pump
MPATLPSAAAPQPAPDPRRPLPAKSIPEPPRTGRWIALGCAAALAAGAGAFWYRSSQPARPAAAIVVRTVRAVRGALQRTVRVSGSVIAKRSSSIIAPRLQAPETRNLDLITLTPNGSFVKGGQVVATIDSRAMRDHLDDIEAQVDQNELDLRKLAAQQVAELESVRQRVLNTRAAFEQARLNAQASPVKTPIEQEQLRLRVEEADLTYREARQQVEMVVQKQSAQSLVAAYNRESLVRHRDRHRNDVVKCTIVTPIAGQVVLSSIRRGRGSEMAQVREGEQVSPGQVFARVVDPASMQVDAALNQVESDLLRIGQHAIVRFDAYPDLVMNGHVESVGSLAAAGRRPSYVRRIPVRIAIEQADPRVIPDLTASADVALDREAEGLLVPREAIREEGGKPVVYVRQEDGGFSPRPVEIGALNNTHAAVVNGLHDGEEIAVQPVQD